MPQFNGTIKEFTKYIGPYARLKVAFLAAKYKKQIANCEECGISDSLDAAHIKGRERVFLIANILSEFMEEDIVRMDLNEFEERFIAAHLPIQSTIRILCRKCHRLYDNENKAVATNKKGHPLEESSIIETLINNQMNKSKAIALACKNLTAITNINTIFSNLTVQESWWLQPHNEKFKTTLHIILNNNKVQKIYVFKLPANSIVSPSTYFKQRNDRFRKNCSDIYIPLSGTMFTERNGFNFTQFKVEEISY